MAAVWIRIWWGRPVAISTSTRQACGRRRRRVSRLWASRASVAPAASPVGGTGRGRGPEGAQQRVGPAGDRGADGEALPLRQGRGQRLGEGAVDLAAAAGGARIPQQRTEPGPGGRAAGADQQTGGVAAEAVHRPGHPGGIPVMAVLQQSEQGVLREAAGGQHRQAAGLVDHVQIAVVEANAPGTRHGGLLPGGPMPDEPISGLQRPIGPELAAVPVELAGGKALPPHRRAGVAVAIGQEGHHPRRRAEALQVGGGDPVAVGAAAVAGCRQPHSTRPCSRA